MFTYTASEKFPGSGGIWSPGRDLWWGIWTAFRPREGGNLNKYFTKIQMPGGLPGGEMLKLRFDWYITCLSFSSVEYFVSSFCVEFSLQPFSNLVYACAWHLGNRKSNQHYTHWRKIRNCLFPRSLFTFYVLCSEKKKLLEKTRKLEN